jgi:hypothetical protein
MQLRYNLLTVKPVGRNPKANSGKVFQAYIQSEVGFKVGVGYQTIFNEVIDLRSKLNQIGASIGLALEVGREYVGWGSGKFAEWTGRAEEILLAPFAQGVAWTRKFGGLPEYVDFTLDCVLVNFDSEEEVFRALNDLYDITVPDVSMFVSRVGQMEVMVDVGGWLIFKECFVTDIDHKFSKMSVEGSPLSVDLTLSITTKYIVDRGLLGVQGKKIVVRELTAEGQR